MGVNYMKINIPKFGNLQNLKILSTGSVLAGPFAATLFAENGAEVIHTESTGGPDILRKLGLTWAQEHHNEKMITLNIPSPDGHEVFLRMIKWCDIWIESSKGGTYDKWGLDDDTLWKVNPKLIIAHISGFGQTGDPEYTGRAAYNSIGQAFSGYASLNGSPDMPYLTRPYLGDYITGIQAAWACLAAYIRSQQTGVGESIDVAMYEVFNRFQAGWGSEGLTLGKPFQRFTGADPTTAGDPGYRCKNGKFVMISMAGPGPLKSGIPLIGLGDDPDFKGVNAILKVAPYAEKFVQALRDFCAARTDTEVEEEMGRAGIPVSRFYDYCDMLEDPHYKARKNIIEYYDPNSKQTFKGFAPSPKFKNNPQQIWCGGGTYGQDNEEVLKYLGYGEEEIKTLYEKKVIVKETK
jgi:Predicted acyl-CoA transferases/carnitine dehydratase